MYWQTHFQNLKCTTNIRCEVSSLKMYIAAAKTVRQPLGSPHNVQAALYLFKNHSVGSICVTYICGFPLVSG